MTAAEWGLLFLLMASVFINYVDRTNLSIAAPQISKELALDPAQMGKLFSAFFWTYAAFQIVSGWLVDRYPVKWVFGIGFFLWTIATAGTGFVEALGPLLVLRVILGAGESVAYPAYSKIIAAGFPEEMRGRLNALIDAASKAGPALGTMFGGYIVATYNWQMLFFILGFGGLIWLAPWFIWAPKTERTDQAVGAVGFADILRVGSAWATFLCLFCINYGWYFILTWLPLYLVQARGFTMKEVATLASLPLWVLAASATVCGFLSDRLIQGGMTATLVRKGFTATGMLLSGAFVVPAALTTDRDLSVWLISAACVAFGMVTSNHWAITQSIAGPLAAGKWTGLQNFMGNLAGVVAPWLTGWIVKETGSFYWAFVLVGIFFVIGAASFAFLVGPVVPIDWAKRMRRA